MLKKRLIPCILVRDNLLVQSINFSKYLPIGKPKIAIEYFNRWDVDEIVVLDITPNKKDHENLIHLTEHISKIAFVPLTVGGGVKSTEDINKLLKAGADKVSINTNAVLNPEFITKASKVFGSQDIVISIDVKTDIDNNYEVYIFGGREKTGIDPFTWSKKIEKLGAGEILLNSIDRDGMKNGYDIQLIRSVVDSVNIPVIAIGGVGKISDIPLGITEGNADAVAAANIFQYLEHSTIQAKAAMKNAGINVRIGTKANYAQKLLHTL